MNEPRPVAQPSAQPAHHPHHPHHPPQAVQQPQGLPRQPGAPAARPLSSPGIGAPTPRPLGGGAVPQARPAMAPQQAGQSQNLPRHGGGMTINPAVHVPVDDEPVALVEDAEDDLLTPATSTMSKIKAFGADSGVKKHEWKRQPKLLGNGPTRVRTFHAKLSDQGLEYLDEAINVFIDGHPEVDIKFVTTNVGMFDGKFKDLALIVNLWY